MKHTNKQTSKEGRKPVSIQSVRERERVEREREYISGEP